MRRHTTFSSHSCFGGERDKYKNNLGVINAKYFGTPRVYQGATLLSSGKNMHTVAEGSEGRENFKCLGNRSEFSKTVAERLRWKMVLGYTGEVMGHEAPHTLN